jgi:hypothetical protein
MNDEVKKTDSGEETLDRPGPKPDVRSSFIVHRSSFIVHRSSFIVHRSSFIVHRSSFILASAARKR